MTKGPAPRVLSDGDLSDLLGSRQFGTLATVKRSGHPHLTTMVYSWDPESRIVRFSTTADRIKVKHLRREPRAALHVPGADVWSFAVAEGEAEVSEVTTVPGDAVGRELLAALPEIARPEDADAFLKQQVDERRVVIRLRVERLYGTAVDIEG
ncbi:pyridoxamine 5'-phosphate oxidase family protein [Streptomyces sp. NPDC001595]|uniref:pyridoxamine 5'-phosphate oxidase family protein n=1 Tax=Streptomyces sp. NPDC001532 TaxID=3154520 RepID=UPI003330B347